MEPKISVISVNWNRKDDLLKMLISLYKQKFSNFEIIIVDNASTDSSIEAVSKKFPKVKIIKMEKNIGLFAGFNKGAEKARGEIIFGIDNDCLIKDDELFKKTTEKFNALPNLGILACLVKDLSTNKELPNTPAIISLGNPEEGYDCLQFSGNAFAIRNNLFNEIGGFNEDYFIYVGEAELSMRYIDAGHLCKFFPDLVVYHATSQQSRSKLYDYYVTRNLLWWYWQYFPFLNLVKRGFGFGPLMKKLVIYKEIHFNLNFLRGISDAFVGLPKILKNRRPYSRKAMEYFYEIIKEDKKAKR